MRFHRRRFAVVAAIGALALVGAAPAFFTVARGTVARPVGLIDCVGKTPARPAEVVLTCADANVSAQHLTWTGWGEPFAAAVGELSVNSCTPNCAAGKFQTFKVVLVVRGARRCPSGILAYDTVTYAFLGPSPAGFGSPSAPLTFRCARR